MRVLKVDISAMSSKVGRIDFPHHGDDILGDSVRDWVITNIWSIKLINLVETCDHWHNQRGELQGSVYLRTSAMWWSKQGPCNCAAISIKETGICGVTMRQKNLTSVKSLGVMTGKRLMFSLEHGFLGEKKTRMEKKEDKFLLEILLILVLDSY